ncbi:DUF3108 domain-containing protein [Crocinitomix catalasitica]|nr:DUF3108 domain-containing protein [Crocinitomix catalasitica]
MKKSTLTILAAVFVLSGVSAASVSTPIDGNEELDKTFKKVNIKAFKPGEKLRYRMSYGIFDAGEVTLEVMPTKRKVKGRDLWRVRGIGRTISAFEWFYKVYDRYESYIDVNGMFPWVFVRRVNEGGYKISQDYTFLQHKNQVDNGEGKKFDTPDMAQDMLSAFYYARTLDFNKAKVNQKFLINIFMDDEIYPAEIKYKGRELIKVRKGKFICHKFSPVVQAGRVFNHEDDLTIWITADENKIPILAKAKIKVGSIRMHLVEWEGVSNKMARITKKKKKKKKS